MNDFSVKMLESGYLQKGETPDQLFKRVAHAGCKDNPERAARIYQYMVKEWFMPATPVLTNLGTLRGQPISCYKTRIGDNKPSIFHTFNEFNWLAADGGGVGIDVDDIREKGATIHNMGTTAGVVPFMKMLDAATSAISQGSVRKGALACFMKTDHPEIAEFIEIRKPTGGDTRRKCFNIHHGVVVTDEFMEDVLSLSKHPLKSRKDGSVVSTVDAFDTFAELLTTRAETGEPYMIFIDNINRNSPEIYKKAGYKVNNSNICVEIALHTTPEKTAVCCLSSMNLVKYDEWKNDPVFIEDLLYFLDGVLLEFEAKIETMPEEKQIAFRNALNFVKEERAVGLGVMGWHDYLQSKLIAFESSVAISATRSIFSHIKQECDKANVKIGKERGSCELAVKMEMEHMRFTHCTSVAPTASIAIICGNVSQGIEPRLSNLFMLKNKTGTTEVKNKYLEDYIINYASKEGYSTHWVEEQWDNIRSSGGSVQNLDWMPDNVKDVFKTAFELDQNWIIEQAAHRQPFIDQMQSINIFIPPTIHKMDLFNLHVSAWKKGVGSLYYCRSESAGKTSVGKKVEREVIHEKPQYETCLSCQ